MTPTTNLSLKKIDGSENWREIFDDHNDSMDLIDAAVKSNSDEISTTEKSLIYVVDGNKCAKAVPVGSYVQLINSTISGRSDGCYTVKTAIPANTAIDNTYFNETAPIAGGAINSLNSKTTFQIRTVTIPYSCSANDQYNTSVKDKIDADLPSDYSCMGIIGHSTNDIYVYVVSCRYSSGSYALQLKNTASTAVSNSIAIDYLAKHN